MAPANNPILQIKGISRVFPGVKALTAVNFRLFPGEVHALMGQNGAGKSTLIKVLTGVHRPDAGSIMFEGQEIAPQSPLDAQAMGISTVYQEITLCPNLSVAENILIGREPRHFGLINWKDMNRQASQLLRDKLNIDLDTSLPVSSYSIAIQQMISIARALYISAKILILDEPTSSLDESEVKQLFSIIRNLKHDGLAILFVTHFLNQAYEISDRFTVLRNGELVGEYLAADLPRLELIGKMIGKEYVELENLHQIVEEAPIDTSIPFIEAKKLGRKHSIAPFDLQIRKNEVLGLAGLLGSGRTELARLLFGLDRPDEGALQIKGINQTLSSPRHAMEAGIAFCPEDRKAEGIIADLSIRENIILALQSHRGIFRYLSSRKQQELADEYIAKLNIKTPHKEQLVRNLSGGNQQKVILARWLATNPELLILDEPTRGIDVGAKAEIQKLVVKMAQEGMSVLFISSELDEVLRCSNRVNVLRDREVIGELQGKQMDESAILRMIASHPTEVTHV